MSSFSNVRECLEISVNFRNRLLKLVAIGVEIGAEIAGKKIRTPCAALAPQNKKRGKGGGLSTRKEREGGVLDWTGIRNGSRNVESRWPLCFPFVSSSCQAGQCQGG